MNCQNDKPLCKLHLVSAYPTLLLFIDGRLAYRHREDRSVYNMIEYVKVVRVAGVGRIRVRSDSMLHTRVDSRSSTTS